ncbi:MAG: hypothetical protein AAGJ35_05355 [Myxococcota bacterium]
MSERLYGLLRCLGFVFGGLWLGGLLWGEQWAVAQGFSSTPRKVQAQAASSNSGNHRASSRPSSTARVLGPRVQLTPVRDPLVVKVLAMQSSVGAFLKKHAIQPNEPWMLAHMLLAFGKSLKLTNGKWVFQHLVESAAKLRKAGSFYFPHFPRGNKHHRIEPHPNMHLKTLLEIGVPLQHVFRVEGRSVTLKHLLIYTQLTFPAQPTTYELPELAWTLDAFARLPPKMWRWRTPQMQTVDLKSIVHQSVRLLQQQTAFLKRWQKQGRRVIIKRRQGIHAYSCGGFQFIQAMLRWMHKPAFRKRYRSEVKAQIDLVFYRLRGEMALYKIYLDRYAKVRKYQWMLLVQQMKFLGHALETLTVAHREGMWAPTAKQRQGIRTALSQLVQTFDQLRKSGAFALLNILKQQMFQTYLDLLGDAGHVMHALRSMHPVLYVK